MADKNFKVKSGLQVPSLTTAGPVTTDSAGNVTSSATLPITQGGTGQTSAGNALNALLPLQTSQDNKFLQTNGVTTQWTIPQQQTSTDGTVGYKIYSGTVTPSSPVTGDIWIDQTTGNGIQLVRWRDTIPSTTTVLNGLDDNNLNLSYTPGNEQVYINGTLITRGQDYTATNGTSITLTQAAEIGDTVEVFGNPLFSVTDVYTQAQANSLYVAKAGFEAAGKNKIINGDFRINQRAFVNVTSNGTYMEDRWVSRAVGTTGTTTHSIETFTPGDAPVLGYEAKNFHRIVTTGQQSTNTVSAIRQGIEDVRTLAGQTVTVSFWAKAGTGTPNIVATLIQAFGSGGSPSSAVISAGTKKPITTSWARYSFTINNPSISGKTLGTTDNTSSLALFIYVSVGSDNNSASDSIGIQNNTFDIWGVQVEAGSIATNFQTATGTIQGELAACHRYYFRYTSATASGNYMPFGMGHGIDANNARWMFQYPVTVRAIPSLSFTAASTFQRSFGSAFTSINPGEVGCNSTSVDVIKVGEFAANSAVLVSAAGNQTAYIEVSSEL